MAETEDQTVKIEAKSLEEENIIRFDIREYLETLPKAMYPDIYSQPASCIGILRLLPVLARHAVMRFLPLTEPIPRSELQFWVNTESSATLANELKRLLRLNILLIPQDESEVPQELLDKSEISFSKYLIMNQTFRKGLFAALSGSGIGTSFGLPSTTLDKYDVDIPFLDRYASTAWEAVLHYLVGTSNNTKHTSSVRHLLTMSGLQEKNPNYDQFSEDPSLNQKYRITSKGFQFLLQGVNVQLWALMLQYVEQAELKLNLSVPEIINFFFQSACLDVGKSYSIEALTKTQKRVLEDLQYFGLFYKRSPDSKRYYPTRIATTLMADAITSQKIDESVNGFIIVETNYKVYAYTSSPLQIAILSLFLDLQSRFQNMVVAVLTRDSIRSALSKGITSDQIISYLTVHAHPEMYRKKQSTGEQLLRPKSKKLRRMLKKDPTIHRDDNSNSTIPITIVDQIKLWEMERNRLKSHPGYIYNNFTGQKSFDELVTFAKNNGYLLWKSSVRRVLIVTEDGHPQIKAFRKQRNEAKQQQLEAESNAVNMEVDVETADVDQSVSTGDHPES